MARVAEGELTYGDRRQLVEDKITELLGELSGSPYVYVYVVDMTDTWAVYRTDGDCTWQVDYTVDGAGDVTLGAPVEVRRVTSYEQLGDTTMAAGESVVATDRLVGRVIEAKPKEKASGGRVFATRIIAYGDSKNRRRYPEAVMRQAAALYEGCKAYDHHRTDEELATSTVQGLVGTFRNVVATAEGLDADLYVMPSAAHVAEALDQSLTNQADGLEPLVGFSHDVIASFKQITDANGDRLMEATQIVSVLSADVVADPAAGGLPTRAVAGGITPPPLQKEMPVSEPTEATIAEPSGPATATIPNPVSESVAGNLAAIIAPAVETFGKGSLMGRLAVDQAFADVTDASVRAGLTESLVESLPDRFSEAQVASQAKVLRDVAARFEMKGLAPTVPADPQVGREAIDRKAEAVDKMIGGEPGGYRSIREAFRDIEGYRPSPLQGGEDENRKILAAIGMGAYRSTAARESIDSTTFDKIMGDSITRRMVAAYNQPMLDSWRKIVSDIVPVNDFRTQRIERLGGYGTLPVVNQGAPYQDLTNPTNEEATYSITKKGGLADLTLEAIANDDLRVVQLIPKKLGLAAAQTLFRFVWDFLPTNATCTYDSTALFHTNHANTDSTAVLGQTTLSAARKKMRKQAAYGDTVDILSIVPKYVVVPSDLEEIAFQLATSAVAIPATPAGAANTPNLHQGLEVIVLDYLSDTNDWFLVADPSMVPTIEVGFYQNQQEPELFVQDDPNQGSWFDADKVTYKIRHIYSGTVLDHRGFYRAVN